MIEDTRAKQTGLETFLVANVPGRRESYPQITPITPIKTTKRYTKQETC